MTRLTVLIRKEGTIFRRHLDLGPTTPTIGLRLSIRSQNQLTFMKLEIMPSTLTWSVWRQEYIFEAFDAGLGPWLESHGFLPDPSYEAY